MYAIYSDGNLLYSPHMIDEGYGVLSPRLTLELNKAGSLEFILPPNNVLFNGIQKLKSVITVEQDGTEIFRGRVLHDEKDFYNRKSIYCEGELSFLLDSVIRPYSFQGGVSNYFKKLLTDHNSQVDPEKQFSIGQVTVTDPNNYITRANSNYPNTLEEVQGKLVGLLGGYLKTRKVGSTRYLDYVTESGTVSDQVIQFGVNMLDITEYINAENVFTVLIPLGKKAETEDGSEGNRLTIESVNGGKDYIEDTTAISIFGRITKTEVWDDVTIASNLLTKGRNFLSSGIEMSVTLSIKAVDLHLLDVKTERIKLGDHIKAESAFNTASNANSLASGSSDRYLSKSDFASYQKQVENNFSTINGKISSVFHYKGNVETFSDLPTTSNVIGDVYNLLDTGANYAWTGSGWDKLSETVDLSGYVKTSVFEALEDRVKKLEGSGI